METNDYQVQRIGWINGQLCTPGDVVKLSLAQAKELAPPIGSVVKRVVTNAKIDRNKRKNGTPAK